MYVTHHPMVIHSCTKYGMTTSGQKSCDPNTKPYQKPYNFDLEVKSQRCIGTMNVCDTLSHSVRPMCQYNMLMSKQTKVTGRTGRHVKNPINLTLRSKVNVVSGSWMYVTHLLMVIDPCAQIRYANVKANRSYESDTTKPYKVDL